MVFEILVDLNVQFLSTVGLPWIFLSMLLESTAFPMPSEGIMPFAGFLVAQGKMDFAAVVLVSTFGSIVGSMISYYIGYYGGKPAILRFGKYLLLNIHHLEATERFFAKYGSITVFIARFVPVVRHLISIPAGVGRMQKRKFIMLTVLGAGIWNAFLIWIGMMLQENWQEVLKYSQILDIVVAIGIIVAVVLFVYKLRKMKGAYSTSAARTTS